MLKELKIGDLPAGDEVSERSWTLRRNLEAFAPFTNDLGRTSVITHKIKTRDAEPFRYKLRLIPFTHRQYIVQKIEKLLAVGAIAPANPGQCPYASLTGLVPKKNGTRRRCFDNRDINAQTEKDAFTLPSIDELWPILSKAKYFASIDLIIGYNQVEVESAGRYKTAFFTHKSLFFFKVMLFSLCNASATF